MSVSQQKCIREIERELPSICPGSAAPRNSEGDGDQEGFCQGHLGADSASAPLSCHPSRPLAKRQGAEAGGNLLIPHPFPFTASFRRLKLHMGTNVTGGTVTDDLPVPGTSPDRLHGESQGALGAPRAPTRTRWMGREGTDRFLPPRGSSTSIWITYRDSPETHEDWKWIELLSVAFRVVGI